MTNSIRYNANAANLNAAFLPMNDTHDRPALEVAGVHVVAYVNPDDGTFRLSVHLDDAEPWLLDAAGTVPMEVLVQGQPIRREPRHLPRTASTDPIPKPITELGQRIADLGNVIANETARPSMVDPNGLHAAMVALDQDINALADWLDDTHPQEVKL